MEHLKITTLHPAFESLGGNKHERKSREAKPMAVEGRHFITRQRKFAGK